MSTLSEKIRVALFAKLNVAAVVGAGKATAVYHAKAPETALFPYLIFRRQAPGTVNYTFGLTLSHEDDLWLIKVLTDEDSSVTKEPEALAEEILGFAETAIGTSLTLTGSETWTVHRQADIPSFTEDQTDRSIYNHGFLLRIVAANV